VRKYPKLPLSHAARGYAYALLGEPADAQARLLPRRASWRGAGESLPAWASMGDDLSHFRTRQLFDQVNDTPTAPLASYFALLTVEHSRMDTLVINMSRLALKNNPGALRVINIMSDNSGVSLQHETTAQSAQAQFALLARLPRPARRSRLPAQRSRIRRPPKSALPRRDCSNCLRRWITNRSAAGNCFRGARMRRYPATRCSSPGFGDSISRSTCSRPTFPSRLNTWWPMLKDHRFAAVIAGFDRTGKLGGDKEMVAQGATGRFDRNLFSHDLDDFR